MINLCSGFMPKKNIEKILCTLFKLTSRKQKKWMPEFSAQNSHFWIVKEENQFEIDSRKNWIVGKPLQNKAYCLIDSDFLSIQLLVSSSENHPHLFLGLTSICFGLASYVSMC